MDKSRYHLEILIDKLTNSIQNTISGDSFKTVVLEIEKSDFKNIAKKKGWNFDWRVETKLKDRVVFKVTILENTDIIQGLASMSDAGSHLYIHLVESAPFNVGKKKLYEGVPGNLFAFACKESLARGYEGFV